MFAPYVPTVQHYSAAHCSGDTYQVHSELASILCSVPHASYLQSVLLLLLLLPVVCLLLRAPLCALLDSTLILVVSDLTDQHMIHAQLGEELIRTGKSANVCGCEHVCKKVAAAEA
jgi:hypothetical protein